MTKCKLSFTLCWDNVKDNCCFAIPPLRGVFLLPTRKSHDTMLDERSKNIYTTYRMVAIFYLGNQAVA